MNAIHSLFDSVGECLTIDTAGRLNSFSISKELQQQLDEWADTNQRGELGEDDRRQYEATLRALNFISLLQSRARVLLAGHNPQ